MSKMKDINVLQRGINFSAHNAGSMFGPPKEALERYVFELNSIEHFSKTHKKFLYASFLLLLALPPIGVLMLIVAYFLSRAKKTRMQGRINEVTERNLPLLEQFFVLKKTSLGFYSMKGNSAEISMKNVMVPVVMPGVKPFMIHIDDIAKLDEMFPPQPGPLDPRLQNPDQGGLVSSSTPIQLPNSLLPNSNFASSQLIFQPQVVQNTVSQIQTSYPTTSLAPPQSFFITQAAAEPQHYPSHPETLPIFFTGGSPESKDSLAMPATHPIQIQPISAPITIADLQYLTSDRRILRQEPRSLLRESRKSIPPSLTTAEETTLLFPSAKVLQPTDHLPLRHSYQATV